MTVLLRCITTCHAEECRLIFAQHALLQLMLHCALTSCVLECCCSFDHRHGFIERLGSVATSRGLDQYDSMVLDRRPAPDQEVPAASTAAVENA